MLPTWGSVVRLPTRPGIPGAPEGYSTDLGLCFAFIQTGGERNADLKA